MKRILISIVLAPTACHSGVELGTESLGGWRVVPHAQNDAGEWIAMVMKGSGNEAIYPVLAIRCRDTRTELQINWGVEMAFNNEGGASIIHSIAGEDQSTTWVLSEEARSTFYSGCYSGCTFEVQTQSEVEEWMSVNTVELAQRLLRLEEEQKNVILTARAMKWDGAPKTGKWDLGGLSTAIHPVREACNW